MFENVCVVTFSEQSGSVWALIQTYENSEIKLMSVRICSRIISVCCLTMGGRRRLGYFLKLWMDLWIYGSSQVCRASRLLDSDECSAHRHVSKD